MKGAVQQADAADEAQGGTRTAGQGAALCPRRLDGRGHRFAADRECSTDSWEGHEMSAVLVAVLALLGQAAAPKCGSADVARERLVELRGRSGPDMTFREVCERVQPPAVIAKYWGSPPRQQMGPWILSARDGNRAVTETILCDFDAADHLVRCTTMDPPWETQWIKRDAYEAVGVGDSVSDVVARLCEPGGRRQDGGIAVFEYWVEQPAAQLHKGCPAYLSFRNGRLRNKRLACR